MMNVLLISPKDPKVPSNLRLLMSGENTYTTMLLSHFPEGVRYTYYSDALKKKEIIYTPWQTVLSLLIKLRLLPLDSGYQCIRLRKRFDLIHCHGYSLKLDGSIKPPVVLGDSSSNYIFLRDYLYWSMIRIQIQYAFRRILHKTLHVFDRDLNIINAILVVFSEFAKKVHMGFGIDSQKIFVVPPGLLKRQKKKKRNNKKIRILFVGVWFERKGGLILLKSYERLKKKYPQLSLTILGPVPKRFQLSDTAIQQIDFIPYNTLVKKFYPDADIFVLVPPRAEGYGMAVVEAASYGIPAVVSRVHALPEIVEHNKTGIVIPPGSTVALIDALEYLITHPRVLKKMGDAAYKKFLQTYWITETNKKLFAVYQKALQRNDFSIM